ncbi:TonB-dependent receptor plug domain-containing protein [Polaribacter dokdonensis]|jgi:TonB-dependent SusC/RagA subfamily outer membrane receptor|uniref:TonB-dependent outer membrane receptor, SusC/RagA subfamily, signature region n=2 Tax=Polaribacter dokdonensis DSW-5 TaxID=1300348 RepID=A0A1H5H432_9FLAO|nr:TonB-dependent receptor plug domain-containing protein [Polaribacter dokdonensis]SEE21968.1 TonB-dependent outer membrane receptor, SusC/RagA subfamily, signature region [Polaribacter dokdonensis DSW-5]
MKLVKTLMLLAAFIFTANFSAQEKKSGEKIKLTILVKDANNNAVPGAVILIDNVKQRRVANKAGYFKVKLDKAPKEITAFSPLVGVKKVAYNGQSSMIINIVSDKNDENYVSGRRDTKIADPIQFRDIYDYLRGKVAGVNVSTTNVISIRGTASWSGARSPLLILNGVPVDVDTFGDIVPTTIRKIKVLKGPETSIYGLRGANGVIEVTTTIN